MNTSTNDIDYFEGNENEPLEVFYLSLNVLAVVT